MSRGRGNKAWGMPRASQYEYHGESHGHPQSQQQQYNEFVSQNQQAPRSSRGGRSKPFRGNKRSTRPAPNVAVPTPPPVSNDVPTGQHLSKTPSVMKNDPLYSEAFFPAPSEELRETPAVQRIYPGCDGFTAIVHQMYVNICAHNHNYKRNISESMHHYYYAVLLLRRLFQIKRANREGTTREEDNFIELTQDFVAPPSFIKYLSGFGNTEFPNGVKYRMTIHDFVLEDSETICGYFGNVVDHPDLYSRYPCLAVYAQRICEDLRFTEDGDQIAWSLPGDFQPLNVGLTEYCLGYALAQELEMSSQNILRQAGITADAFKASNRAYPLNTMLMTAIERYLKEVPKIKLEALPESVGGSQAQIVTECIEDQETPTFSVKSPVMIAGSITFLGGGFMYRLDRALMSEEQIIIFSPFYIIQIACEIVNPEGNPENQEPQEREEPFPANAIRRQRMFHITEDQKLNVFDFETTPYHMDIRARKIVEIDIQVRSDN